MGAVPKVRVEECQVYRRSFLFYPWFLSHGHQRLAADNPACRDRWDHNGDSAHDSVAVYARHTAMQGLSKKLEIPGRKVGAKAITPPPPAAYAGGLFFYVKIFENISFTYCNYTSVDV